MQFIQQLLQLIVVVLALGGMAYGIAMLVLWPRWQLRMTRQANAALARENDQLRKTVARYEPAVPFVFPAGTADVLAQHELSDAEMLALPASMPADERGLLQRVPEGMWPILTMRMRYSPPKTPYSFALGWAYDPEQREPFLHYASFHSDAANFALHTLLTGRSGSGKDIAAFIMLVSLCAQHGPNEVKICWISKKKQDAEFWRGKAHLWCPPAIEDHEIEYATTKLVAELEQREHALTAARVSKWENYRGTDMPLLVVYLSELDSVAQVIGVKEFDAWLSTFLSRCRSAGIRVIIAPQNVNNKSTNWRGNTELQFAGFQRSVEYDRPSVGMTPDEIRKLGGLPPSEIPGPGIFTTAIHRTVVMVRLPNLTDQQRWDAISILPDGGPTGLLVPQPEPERPGAEGVAPPLQRPQPTLTTAAVLDLQPQAPRVEVEAAPASVPVAAPVAAPVAVPVAAPVAAPGVATDAEALSYALFLVETSRERDRATAVVRAAARSQAGDDERLAYALYLIDTKQVDGISRAVERAWDLKRGGGKDFQTAKGMVATALQRRAPALHAAIA